MDEEKKRIDYKSAGYGVGGAVALLLALQSQGVDLMTKNQASRNDVVIEKTIANSQRISNLENTVTNLSNKIDSGFTSVRDKIDDVFSKTGVDRFTKTEHIFYSRALEGRLERIEEDLTRLEKRVGEK